MSRLLHLDILNLPPREDDGIEYKSSATNLSGLKEKVGKAASGFWNSGGGVFVAGVDEHGKPDGGFATVVGRQSVQDWIDQAVQQVAPAGSYSIRVFEPDATVPTNIAAGKGVIAIEFSASSSAPHMAPDNKYYIRAGAHTVPAPHYIVEALWARRRLGRPFLTHSFRPKPGNADIIQLAVVTLTDEPAINVSVIISPLPELWKDVKDPFPVVLPLIDSAQPFVLDLTTYHMAAERLGQNIQLRVKYHDISGNSYDYERILDVMNAMAPWRIGTEAPEKMARSLESIEKALREILKAITR